MIDTSIIYYIRAFLQVRWSVCSQEICFKNGALSAFFGAGNHSIDLIKLTSTQST